MKKIRKMFTVGNIVGFISFLFIAWVFLSWVEVVTHNAPHQPAYTYSDSNFFVVLGGEPVVKH